MSESGGPEDEDDDADADDNGAGDNGAGDSESGAREVTRRTFSPIGEAALARLEARAIELAQHASRLPSRGELIDAQNDVGHLAEYSYWTEPRGLLTEAYLDEDAARDELPEQYDVINHLKALFIKTMVAHTQQILEDGDFDAGDDDYDERLSTDALDVDDDEWGDEGDAPSRLQPYEEEPEEEP